MKRKSLALILLLILLLAQAMPVLAVDVPAVSDPVTDFTPLDTTAPAEIFTTEVGAAVLLELNSGTTLYALNADVQRYPASLTKVMTAYLTCKYGNLDDQVTVSETALQNLHEDGSTVGLQAGEVLPLRETFKQLTTQQVTAPQGKLGKVVKGFTWEFATILGADDAARLQVGQDVTLKFSQIAADAAAEVTAINTDEQTGESLVVFSSEIVSGELVSIRQQEVDIVLATHAGLRVPVSAITMDENGNTGVLILTGNIARFKQIDVQNAYKGEEYYIVPKGTTQKYLLLNDEVVVHPSGSNNLKVISS